MSTANQPLICFEESIATDQLDRAGFTFRHKLLGHPSLSLENLGRVLPTLPKNQVMFSKTSLANGDDFETTFRSRPRGHSIEETIETIRTSASYIMVQAPEVDPSFADLHKQLKADVETLMRRRGIGGEAMSAKLYLFIASPNAVTPFHIDRYSTILMQFSGNKTVTVFPQWDDRVVSAPNREAYVDYEHTQLPWSKDIDSLGHAFSFSPGDSLHIPFVAGHHVKNGSDDVSISMSIIFNTEESMMWRRAICFNHHMRKRLAMLGMQPFPVGATAWRDQARSGMYRVGEKMLRVLGRAN